MSEGFAIRSGMIEVADTATIWPHRLVLMQVHGKDSFVVPSCWSTKVSSCTGQARLWAFSE
eukprot:9477314-Pyramimonas_sp.AAC.1